jgi:chemotaxis protein histidine kinase CheA
MKELLVTQLAKQLGALSDPRVRAIIVAEVDRALAANCKVSAEDVRRIEKDVRATVSITRIGTLEAPKTMDESGLAAERINWGVIDEFKKVHGDEAERAKLQRAKDARTLLYSQIKHQIGEKEAARRRLLAEEAEFVRKQKAELGQREVDEARQAAERKARTMQEMLDNREHVRIHERRRKEEAHVRQLEDERLLTDIRGAELVAKAEKARQKVEKAKRLEFAKLADERSTRMKAEQRVKDAEEQRRLDVVWQEILNEQARKREEGLRRVFEKQAIRAEAYGKSAGAELKEKAAKDELNMLRWQTIYAQQQEERCVRDSTRLPRIPPRPCLPCKAPQSPSLVAIRAPSLSPHRSCLCSRAPPIHSERSDKQRLFDREQDIQRSLKAQMELAAQKKRADRAEDARRVRGQIRPRRAAIRVRCATHAHSYSRALCAGTATPPAHAARRPRWRRRTRGSPRRSRRGCASSAGSRTSRTKASCLCTHAR